MTQETDIVKSLDTVTSNLEARQDYRTVMFQFVGADQSISAPNAVQTYNSFKQEILLQEAKDIPVSVFSVDEVIVITNAIINSNLAMQTMGQLSTSRTIEPTTAESNNISLKTLLSELMDFKATLQLGPIPASPTQEKYGPKGT